MRIQPVKPAPGNRAPHIMILTGEPSGDFHAAPLIRALKKLVPGIRISGIGGPAMAGQGAEIFFPIERLSAMGLIQVARQFSTIRQAFRTVQQRLNIDRPDVLVLIDYPGFNLRAAKYVHENLDIPVCYYIAPKAWAWNASRFSKIKDYTDHVALILPFELPIYKKLKISATYVGNPLVDEYPAPPSGQDNNVGCQNGFPVIGLLPGSRSSEINKLLPVMLDTAQEIVKVHGKARFLISSGIAQYDQRIRQILEDHPIRQSCSIVSGRPAAIFKTADMLIAASGTVTLEAALCQVPTIIVYKLSPLAFALGQLLVKVKYAGLANLIMGREVMPELLQKDASPEKISKKAFSILSDLSAHRRQLAQVRQRLGTPGAPDRTAKIIINIMGKERKPGA
ncbi:MAG: lipid-A-disaccharide synthase [Desulfobacter sp.]|nr:MAG: lipid-A-disaccharide synthase [Desulfobacter sp.]